MKLGEVIDIKVGMNLSRQKDKSNWQVYTNEDFANDLNGLTICKDSKYVCTNQLMAHTILEKDIIYNFITSEASLVGASNSGKTISQNFAKITFDNTKLDGAYLCFLLNEEEVVKRQKYVAMQGSVLKRLSPAIIKTFETKLPILDEQKFLGNVYINWLRRQALMRQQLDIENRILLEFLNKRKVRN